jgi:hypothetical protein
MKARSSIPITKSTLNLASSAIVLTVMIGIVAVSTGSIVYIITTTDLP